MIMSLIFHVVLTLEVKLIKPRFTFLFSKKPTFSIFVVKFTVHDTLVC